MERTRRQDMISGWDSDKISSSKIGVVGTGTTAQSLCLYLSCLGVGKIYLVDTARMDKRSLDDFLINPDKRYYARIDAIKETLQDIKESPNESMKVREYQAVPSAILLDECDAIVDCTNDAYFKERSLAAAVNSRKARRFISCSVGSSSCYVRSTDTRPEGKTLGFGDGFDLSSDYSLFPEEHALSGIAAAVACDEVRRAIMPLDKREEEANRDPRHFYYNLLSPERNQVGEESFSYASAWSNILVVGAGGTGTYALLNLALSEPRSITIADGDQISVSNLNRQGLYSIADVGRNKAKAISEKLSRLCPDTEYRTIESYIENESQIDVSDYDIVLSCVDNAGARKLLSKMCADKKVPMMNAGVSPFSGKVEFYIPGKSACISCQNDGYYSQIEEEKKSRRDSGCADIGEPSIVVTNALAGSMMAAEAVMILSGNDDLAGKTIGYDSSPGLPYLSVYESGCLDEGCSCSCHGG